MIEKKEIVYTDKQLDAFQLWSKQNSTYNLVEGSARSGKTFGISDYIIQRAIKYPGTRHVICRKSKTSCKNTVWEQTFLPLLEDFKNYENISHPLANKIIFNNGSEVHYGGFDNKIHQDDILGSEWATIYLNEAIDLEYNTYDKLQTRLNWKIDKQGKTVPLKLFLDYNPKAPSHWGNKLYKKNLYPDNEKIDDKLADEMTNIHFHILDNEVNLSPKYIEKMRGLRGLAKKRFWDGIAAEDSEGIVYHAFDRRINVVDEPIKPIPEAETFTAWDFGVSDPCFVGIGQILQTANEQVIINFIDEYTNKNKSAEYYGKYLQTKPYSKYINRRDYGDPSGKNRDAQLKSWISELWNYGFQIQYTSSYSIDEMIDSGNNIIPFVRVCEKQCPKIVEMFENWKYPLDTDGTKKVGSKPNHCIQSHPGTSFYYMACNRFGTKGAKLIV